MFEDFKTALQEVSKDATNAAKLAPETGDMRKVLANQNAYYDDVNNMCLQTGKFSPMQVVDKDGKEIRTEKESPGRKMGDALRSAVKAEQTAPGTKWGDGLRKEETKQTKDGKETAPKVQSGEAITRNADRNITRVERPDGRTIDMKYDGKELKEVCGQQGRWTKGADGWTRTDMSTGQITRTAQDVQVQPNGDLVIKDNRSVETKRPDGSAQVERADNSIIEKNADGKVTSVTRPDGRTKIDMVYTGKELEAVKVGSGQWAKDKDGKGWTFKDSNGKTRNTAEDLQVRPNGDIVIKEGSIQKTESPNGSTKIEKLHTVERGESFWSIAEKELKSTKLPGEKPSGPEILAKAKEIAAANNKDLNSTIHPGDTLKLPRTTEELKQAQAKEGADLTFGHLKEGLQIGNLSTATELLQEAKAEMPPQQYKAYLTRLNEMVQKELGIGIVDTRTQGDGNRELIVKHPDGTIGPLKPEAIPPRGRSSR